jgi:hypothetical protein
MMLAASASLIFEGWTLEEEVLHHSWLSASLRVVLGVVGGLLFILCTKSLLEQHEEIKFAGLDGEGGPVP